MSGEDRAWAAYSAEFRTKVLPKLLSSAVLLSIQADGDDFDVRQATEIGAALLFDKPMLLVVPRGRTLPARLRRIADAVVEDWVAEDERSQQQLLAALHELGVQP